MEKSENEGAVRFSIKGLSDKVFHFTGPAMRSIEAVTTFLAVSEIPAAQAKTEMVPNAVEYTEKIQYFDIEFHDYFN